jgi:hypothetical protein
VTGSTIIGDTGQAEQFAFSVVQDRRTQCRYAYFRSNTRLGTAGAFTRSASERVAAIYSPRLIPTSRFASSAGQVSPHP